MFYRINENGNAVILNDSGTLVTSLTRPLPCVYPIGSNVSAYYEHPEGIVLTVDDAKKCGIEAE